MLRSKGFADPYSLIASLTRGKHISEKEWKQWIHDLQISDTEKKQIWELTPQSYTGLAIKLTEKAIARIKKSQKSSDEK